MGHIGLALTSSLTLSFNAFLLSRAAKGMGVAWDRTAMWRSILGLILAGSFAYGLCLLVNYGQLFTFAQDIWSGRLTLFLDLSLSGAALVLCFGLAAMKVWDLNPQRVKSLVMSRLRRKP